jgi:anionic cell wall polymer biosynthesis LytR-Cps2A-Psr (LCP) family protein
MRSRHTQELTEDGWHTLPGMNDLVRNERQRTFLIDIMGRMADFTSPQAMTAAARAVAPFLTVDSDLTLFEAVDIAWTLRGYGSSSVVQLEVPVYDATTDAGAQVLMASVPVDEIVSSFLSDVAAGGGVVFGVAGW